MTTAETASAPALYTYTFRYPGRANTSTLDCFAESREAALRSARRYIARENRRLARAGFSERIRTPTALFIINETEVWARRAALAAATAR